MDNKEILERVNQITNEVVLSIKSLNNINDDIVILERKIKGIESDIRMNIMLNPEVEVNGSLVKLSNDNLRNSYINNFTKQYKEELDSLKSQENILNNSITIYYVEKFRLETILKVKEFEAIK